MESRDPIHFNVYILIDVDDIVNDKTLFDKDKTLAKKSDIASHVWVAVYKNKNGSETFTTFKGSQTIKLDDARLKDEVQFKASSIMQEPQEYKILLHSYEKLKNSESNENMRDPEFMDVSSTQVSLLASGQPKLSTVVHTNYWNTTHIVPGQPGDFRCIFEIYDKKGASVGFCAWKHKIQSGDQTA
ncbi:TPA: AidA/PixA family protein [Pseudomonas aeruginosa]